MKILYISPENTVGTLTLWKRIHEENGNECRTITFFHSPKNFKEDICLKLPFNFTYPFLSRLRNLIFMIYRGREGYFQEKPGCPPIWKKEGLIDSLFLKFKDFLWRPKIMRAIQDYNLYDFDVYHFESGMDFLKNEFFVKRLHSLGKKIICHYHGEDLRSRGVMPYINKYSSLNITNEVDLLEKHPNIKYLFLPFQTKIFNKKDIKNKVIRVAHAPTNRFYKGSDHIIKECKKLESFGFIEFDLIEGLSHRKALERKAKSDIFIDQIGDRGGWGYGMNSVESLSMGICTLTEINNRYNNFIPDHPFISITQTTFLSVLKNLIVDPDRISKHGSEGKIWVEKYHDIKSVSKKLYNYYTMIGL